MTMSSVNMSMEEPAGSCNVSRVSLPVLPLYPWSSCQPLSPCMVIMTLNAIGDDIDVVTLHSICDGLLETIKTHEMVHHQVEDQLSEQV
jgi:hypothetical protein